MRRTYRLLTALALALVTALVAPMAAHAAGYQFWGYYQLVDGEWAFATEGAGTTVPEDGTVDGFRFAVSAGSDTRVPRDVLEFDEICTDTPAEDGMKRVGLVIDPGRPVDGPEGATPPEPGAQCVLAGADATSQEILIQAVEEIRTDDSGLICGIAGYPATGCGDEVAEPSPEQLAADEPVDIPIAAPISEGGDGAEPTSGTTDDPAGATESGTSSESEPAASESATSETTADETTADESTDDSTSTDAAATTDSDGGIPPWAWAVGVVVLLGILAWAATAARNRRVDALGDDEFPGEDHRH